jgi:hypothetical protein
VLEVGIGAGKLGVASLQRDVDCPDLSTRAKCTSSEREREDRDHCKCCEDHPRHPLARTGDAREQRSRRSGEDDPPVRVGERLYVDVLAVAQRVHVQQLACGDRGIGRPEHRAVAVDDVVVRSAHAGDLEQIIREQVAEQLRRDSRNQDAPAIWRRERERVVDRCGRPVRQHVAESVAVTRARERDPNRASEQRPSLRRQSTRGGDDLAAPVEQGHVGAERRDLQVSAGDRSRAVAARVLQGLLLAGLKQAVDQRRCENRAIVDARLHVPARLRLRVGQLDREHGQQREYDDGTRDEREQPVAAFDFKRLHSLPLDSNRAIDTSCIGRTAEILDRAAWDGLPIPRTVVTAAPVSADGCSTRCPADRAAARPPASDGARERTAPSGRGNEAPARSPCGPRFRST